MTDQCLSAAAAIVSTAAAMAAVATNEGRPEEAALWATILLAARRLETGKLTGGCAVSAETWRLVAVYSWATTWRLPGHVIDAMGWINRAKREARS